MFVHEKATGTLDGTVFIMGDVLCEAGPCPQNANRAPSILATKSPSPAFPNSHVMVPC